MRHISRAAIADAHLRTPSDLIAAARENPGLLPEIMHHREDLLSRFAANYIQLRALPRRVRRALQRQWHLPLAGVALMLALGQSPALAATIPVGGSCTLVDAITAANTDTATGGCPGGSGADIIVLPAGSTHTLRNVNNNTYPFGPSGLPVISSAITIEGNGSTVVRDSTAPEFRVMAVSNTADLTLKDAVISGGVSFGYYGGGGVSNGGTLTITNSTISGNYSRAGSGVFNFGTLTVTDSTISGNSRSSGVLNYGTLTVTNSTISGNFGRYGRGVSNHFPAILTITNSTISGNSSYIGSGGVSNYGGTVTITNCTISGNSGSGVHNDGTLTVTNSTISGNAGDGVDNGGTLTVTNSTISGNSSNFSGGGVYNGGTLTLVRVLISGNTAPTGPEVLNSFYGTVFADNYNLFGVNGNAGVVGFTPGPTDIVPPAGVQLSEILNPLLAFNGGPTQTHALVPGSPAIDAGGPVCTDINGNPLLTDQRGKPRIVDGNEDGIAACDIGAFEFFPVVNNLVTLDPGLDTAFDPTPVPDAPAGTFTITARFTNTSGTPLRFPFFTVRELSDGNLLLNAEEGAQGIGATINPDVGDQVLSPGETVAVDFVIGLQTGTPFTFFVDLFGEPLVSGTSKVRQRPNVTTKGVRR